MSPRADTDRAPESNQERLDRELTHLVRHENKNPGCIEKIKALIKEGADVQVQDNLPIRWAASFNSLDLVKLFQSHGANIHVWEDYILKDIAGNQKTPDVLIYLLTQDFSKASINKTLESLRGHPDSETGNKVFPLLNAGANPRLMSKELWGAFISYLTNHREDQSVNSIAMVRILMENNVLPENGTQDFLKASEEQGHHELAAFLKSCEQRKNINISELPQELPGLSESMG